MHSKAALTYGLYPLSKKLLNYLLTVSLRVRSSVRLERQPLKLDVKGSNKAKLVSLVSFQEIPSGPLSTLTDGGIFHHQAELVQRGRSEQCSDGPENCPTIFLGTEKACFFLC